MSDVKNIPEWIKTSKLWENRKDLDLQKVPLQGFEIWMILLMF